VSEIRQKDKEIQITQEEDPQRDLKKKRKGSSEKEKKEKKEKVKKVMKRSNNLHTEHFRREYDAGEATSA